MVSQLPSPSTPCCCCTSPIRRSDIPCVDSFWLSCDVRCCMSFRYITSGDTTSPARLISAHRSCRGCCAILLAVLNPKPSWGIMLRTVVVFISTGGFRGVGSDQVSQVEPAFLVRRLSQATRPHWLQNVPRFGPLWAARRAEWPAWCCGARNDGTCPPLLHVCGRSLTYQAATGKTILRLRGGGHHRHDRRSPFSFFILVSL